MLHLPLNTPSSPGEVLAQDTRQDTPAQLEPQTWCCCERHTGNILPLSEDQQKPEVPRCRKTWRQKTFLKKVSCSSCAQLKQLWREDMSSAFLYSVQIQTSLINMLPSHEPNQVNGCTLHFKLLTHFPQFACPKEILQTLDKGFRITYMWAHWSLLCSVTMHMPSMYASN